MASGKSNARIVSASRRTPSVTELWIVAKMKCKYSLSNVLILQWVAHIEDNCFTK